MKFKKTIFRFLYFLLLAFLVGFTTIRNRSRIPKEKVFRLNWKGENSLVSPDFIEKTINENVIKKFLVINSEFLNNIEKEVYSINQVQSVKAYYTVSRDVNIDLKEHSVVARLKTFDGQFYLSEGSQKVELSPFFSVEVPLVVGNFSEEDFNQIHKLVKKIKEDSYTSSFVVGISKSEKYGFLLKTIVPKHSIAIGEPKNIEAKLDRLKYFYTYLGEKEAWAKYEVINLEIDNQVIGVKKEQNE